MNIICSKIISQEGNKWMISSTSKKSNKNMTGIFILYDSLLRFLSNPILICKIVYWICSSQITSKYFDKMIKYSRFYFQAGLNSRQKMNCLHAAAFSNNLKAVQEMIDHQLNQKNLQKLFDENRHIIDQGHTNLTNNFVFPFTDEELDIYKDVYKKEIKDFIKFEKIYLHKVAQYLKKSKEKLKSDESLKKDFVLSLDNKEQFGNTPLHIASLKGHLDIVDYLVKHGGDPQIENKEFFKARELSQHKKIIKYFKNYMENNQNHDDLIKVSIPCTEIIKQIIKSKNKIHKKKKKNKIILAINEVNKENQEQHDNASKSLYQFQNELFVPDLVLKCKLKAVKSDGLQTNFFSLEEGNHAEYQRINFLISMLQNAQFKIYLMKSYAQPGYMYIMLKHAEQNLRIQAQQMKLQVKLMDQYDLEPFSVQDKDLFEPFRSRQRQEIIECHVKRIINLDQLITV